jgi:hypothetical protein
MRMETSLSGMWTMLEEDGSHPRPFQVPGVWEVPEGQKNAAGPFWFQRTISIPAAAANCRVLLRFAAVSYACEVWIGDRMVGQHIGMWDAFEIDITDAVMPGTTALLRVKVEKPAALTAGPDSASLAGRFPLRSTLSGFLPYVWGQIFGGIWQDVQLIVAGPALIADVFVDARPDGQVMVDLSTAGGSALLSLQIRDEAEQVVVAARMPVEPGPHQIRLQIPEPQAWSPAQPALYTLELLLGQDDAHQIGFGLREVQVAERFLLLNGQPIYPRMALSWGWYADRLDSNPTEEQVIAELSTLKAMGYNGVKLCLWFPPEHYFALADQLGMLLWIELPMWIPQPDAHFCHQVPLEYERLVRQARRHPAVVIYSLGCELNRAVGPEILEPTYRMVKQLVGSIPVRDNSGSGVAYGGLLHEYADYDDYHFYCDLQHFRAMVEHFAPRWRAARPWLFGEFCDYDTFRDPEPVADAWWMQADPQINPQGARWLYEAPFLAERLHHAGLWPRRAELAQLSYQHGLLHRKLTIEATRSFDQIGGYVVTGMVDTPISTAGMWNDQGQPKWPAEAFARFNNNTILLLGWDSRRTWQAGGDRPARSDYWSYRSGGLIRLHVLLSFFPECGAGRAPEPIEGHWLLRDQLGNMWGQGVVQHAGCAPGSLCDLGVAELVAPDLPAPRRATLTVQVTSAGRRIENEWPLWILPARALTTTRGVAICDPRRLLDGLSRFYGVMLLNTTTALDPATQRVIVCTTWNEDLADYVAAGGRVILLETGDPPTGLLPLAELPFWREALRLIEPHPCWGDLVHDGWADLQFSGCATDLALDLRSWDGPATVLLRRVDTRTAAVHAYAALLGAGQGQILISTLRLWGGQGDQPSGILRNPAAIDLLGTWIEYLSQTHADKPIK